MIEITFEIIRNKFKNLITKNESREEISEWASAVRKRVEAKEIQIIPQTQEKKIWEILLFLEGCDMPDFNNEYLQSQNDVEQYYNKII